MISSHSIGKDCLGPLIYRFCYRLWLHQQTWTDRDAIVLFMARGGIRLRVFYDLFLEASGLPAPLPMADMYVSRMAVFLANMADRPEETVDEVAKEFRGWYVRDAMGALLPWSFFEPWWLSLTPEIQQAYQTLPFDRDWLLSPEGGCHDVPRQFYRQQATLLRRHMDEVRQGHSSLLLVDTGWSGSILAFLQAFAPDLTMMGHFFGRYAYGEAWKPWFHQLVGIEVEQTKFRWNRPQTCIFLHRHLIEGMCEIAWPSVESYRIDPERDVVVSQSGPIPDDQISSGDGEAFAQGVEEYIRTCGVGLHAHAIQRAAVRAANSLRSLVCFPREREARCLTVPTRSADFGKNLDVRVLLEPDKGAPLRDRIRRIDRSLWREGQIALEFPRLARIIQYALLRAPQWTERLAKRFA